MGMDVCANCGEGLTLTRTECDSCGWIPASRQMADALGAKKTEYRKMREDFERTHKELL